MAGGAVIFENILCICMLTSIIFTFTFASTSGQILLLRILCFYLEDRAGSARSSQRRVWLAAYMPWSHHIVTELTFAVIVIVIAFGLSGSDGFEQCKRE